MEPRQDRASCRQQSRDEVEPADLSQRQSAPGWVLLFTHDNSQQNIAVQTDGNRGSQSRFRIKKEPGLRSLTNVSVLQLHSQGVNAYSNTYRPTALAVSHASGCKYIDTETDIY